MCVSNEVHLLLSQSEHRYDLYAVGFPAVAREMTELDEGLVALQAPIRTFFRVRPLVVLQVRGIHKLFPAGPAGVRLLPGVPSFVYFKAA